MSQKPSTVRPKFGVSGNAIFAALSSGVTALALFFVYRLTTSLVGIAGLGTLSLTMGLISLCAIVDLGMPLSIVRQVARLHADRVYAYRIRRIIIVIACYSFASTLLMGLIATPAVKWIVDLAISRGGDALPYSLVLTCALVTAASSASLVATGALEGLERYDVKFCCTILGNIALLATALGLIPIYGIVGIAMAFAAQALAVTVFGSIFLASHFRNQTANDRTPIVSLLKHAGEVGVPLRLAGLASLFFEPLTRLMVGSFGGMSSVGIYEAASRLCVQTQTLISSALQVVVPRLSRLVITNDHAASGRLYDFASGVASVTAVVGLGFLVLIAPCISEWLFADVKQEFIFVAALLSSAWMIHVLAAPTYFANLAEGTLRWNWLSQWIAVVSSAAIGAIAGHLFGGMYVPLGPAAGLILATSSAIVARRFATGRPAIHVPWTYCIIQVTGFLLLLGLEFAMTGPLRNSLFLFQAVTALGYLLLCAFVVVRYMQALPRDVPSALT